MNCYKLSLVILLLLPVCCGFGQVNSDTTDRKYNPLNPYTEKALKLVVGIHLQQAKYPYEKEYSRKYIEIGIHKTRTSFVLPHPPVVFGHGFSTELSLERQPIVGLKYGCWYAAYIFSVGVHGIYYTNLHHGNFKIRPEFGLGAHTFKLTAGFNIPTLYNRQFKELSQANGQISLNIFLKVKTLERKELN